MKTIAWILLTAVILLVPDSCRAAFKSSADGVSPKEACNPRPQADDIILPMPCHLTLALRPVAIPQGALIRDKSFVMGVNNPENQDRQIYERQFPGHIAAPFTAGELPGAWKGKIKAARGDGWYFIGKYEISRLQYEAVMEALGRDGVENASLCPRATSEANLPQVGISWFDAQEFLNKYNAWLVKNHKGQLPAFAGTQNIAFLRLPTEEEWEYAARGGAHVPPEWWAENDIFPLDDGKKLADYAVTSQQQPLAAPLGIGSRLANPLGLYDTAGNAREMVDGFFRLSIPDMSNGQVVRRLHGAAGGILTKGGSFRNPDDAALPGWRDEIPLYTAAGISRPTDVGMRVVLAGLNIPNAQRLEKLRSEVGSQNVKPRQPESLGSTPLEAVDALAAHADADLRKNLLRLKAMLTEQAQAQSAQDQQTLEQTFRSVLYQSETLRAFAFRYSAARQQLDKVKNLLSQKLEQDVRVKARNLLATAQKDLKDYLESLRMGASYYKNTVVGLAARPEADVDRLAAQTRQEYGSGTVFDRHMRENLANLEKNLASVRARGAQALNIKGILQGILPPQHFKQLDL